MEEKKLLRQQIQEQLRRLTEEQFQLMSAQITEHVVASTYFKEAKTIAITISRGREVDTTEIIKCAWEMNKEIVVPRANFVNRSLDFMKIHTFTQLEETKYGLLEPIQVKCEQVPAEQFDLIIVPGLAFTKDGSRLGFGGGFYDRYLQGLHTPTISLAFPCQLVEELPKESHDQKVDCLILPNGILK